MSDLTPIDPWTPDLIRERFVELGIPTDATDEQLGEVIEEVIAEARPQEPAPELAYDPPLPPLPPELVGKPCRCLDPNCTIPYGICHCGCGGRTTPYLSTDARAMRVKGQYGLSLVRHTTRIDGGGIAMPFLAAARRARSGQPPTGMRRNAKTLTADKSHVAMFEAFASRSDKTREVRISALDAMLIGGVENFPNPTPGAASRVFKELITLGCIISHGPRIKELVRHPDGTLFVPSADAPDKVKWKYERTGLYTNEAVAARKAAGLPASVKPTIISPTDAPVPGKAVTPKAVTPKGATHTDMLAAVSPKEMADALANAMWTRYEWALSELGAAREALAARDDEIARLRSLLDGIEPDASEIARRILNDAPTN